MEESEEALAKEDVKFFRERLPRREYYRIAASFPDRCVFLDIETTGLSRYYDQVTLVGWSTGSRYEVLIDPTETVQLEHDLSDQPILITFNGTLFDLPFLASRFDTDWSAVTHVDLRYVARRAGLTGGQKKIEVAIGVERETRLDGVSGAEAVGLWFDYKGGSLSALRKLVRYNHADIEGMKFIFERVIGELEQGANCEAASRKLFARSSVRFTDSEDKARGNIVYVMPYKGPAGPRLKYTDLRKRAAQLESVLIVGIDLTGERGTAIGVGIGRRNEADDRVGVDGRRVDRKRRSLPDRSWCLSIPRCRFQPDGKPSSMTTQEEASTESFGTWSDSFGREGSMYIRH